MALAALATSHPYKLDADLRTIQSNQDLNNKPGAYQLQPAPFREYPAQLRMQGKKPPPSNNDTDQDTKSKFNKNSTHTT